MKRFTYLILTLFLIAYVFQTTAAGRERYNKEVFIESGDSLLYRILYPNNFSPEKEYPVVLFLHGAGDRGNNNERQLWLGADLFIREDIREDYPAIVIFPQCPADTMWTARQKWQEPSGDWIFKFPVEKRPPRPAELVANLMEDVIEESYTDDDRIYIMGISMGGIGTLEFLHRYPTTYAAAIVYCGGHDIKFSDSYKHTPIWFFHGDADNVVPEHYSIDIYNKIKKDNKATKYTSYPGVDHNCWDRALAEPTLLKWLFKHKR